MKDKKHIIIAIGASAGGLEALQEFILNIPANMVNISVIIAQHLSPTHKSMLVQLLSRETKKSIVEAEHNSQIKPNVIYITPPDKDITVVNEKIHLTKPKSSLGPKPSVDLLFQSLATSSCNNVIGVILSGTGSDGAKGVQALKEAGAFIIVQEPKTAKYDGMPMSAIQTGVVDLVLSPDRMASEILDYMLNPLDDSFSKNTQDFEDPLEAIIKLLSLRVGTDFGGYKIGTISRRLQKRLVHIGKKTYQEYLEYVKEKPEELDEMFKYALIGVTGFFRDYESFEVLHKELEKLFSTKKTGDTIRIWIPGCSTGEEAFTISILIHEILKEDVNTYNIRIFATDIDEEAISNAKKGVYSASQLENIPAELKSKYFTSKGKLFEINKNLRNIILFSRHDITKNPPFLKLDLISCRNLLIYFGNELQKYLIPIFHYSLNPNGLLFLGKSETVGQFTQLFATLDGKNKLFQRKYGEGVAPVKFQPTITRSLASNYQERPKNKPLSIAERVKQTILKTYENPYVVIDKDFIIHEIKGDLRLFLSLKSGVIQLNLIKLVNSELQIELRSLITKAIKENIGLTSDIKRFNLFGKEHYVRFKIKPLDDNILDAYYLVIFETLDLKGALLPKTENIDVETIENQRIQELEYELNATKEHLQTYIEEIETSNEELQSLNEEMQSTNEELQSSNEELETTNEELQSTNEEIQVAYNELRQVHTILERKEHLLNEKEQNQTALLSNTLQAFFLIDREFTIQTFNSVANELSKKLRSDSLKIGDSFIKLVSTNNMHLFATEVQKSFKGETITGEVMEHNFKGEKIWLMFSLTPVLGMHGKIESVTIGILDITEKKIFSQKLTSTERLLHSIFDAAVTGICITDENGYFVDVNSEYCNIYGYESQELIGKHFTTVVPEHYRDFMTELHDRFIAGEDELDAEWTVQRKNGSLIDIFAKANLIKYDDGKRFKVTSVKDISESKKYTNLLSGTDEISIVGGWEYDTISSRFEWTDETFEIFRVGKNFEISLYSMAKLFNDEAAAKLEESLQAAISNGKAFDLELEYNTAKDELLWIRLTCKPLRIHNQTIRLFGTAQNITHRKRQEIEILNSRQRYKSTFDNSLIGFLISHPDGRILDANSAIVEMLGYSKEELIKLGRQPILDSTSPMFEAMFKEREETGKTKGELYFIKKDGKRILCEVYSSVYFSESGEKFASTLINDISEREMMQNQLKTITSNLPGVFYKYVMKPDGSDYFAYMSEGSMKMMSIPHEQIMDDPSVIWSKIHEDDLEDLVLSVQESAHKLKYWTKEFRFKHPDGSIRWHRGSANPFKEADGSIIWNSIVLDITKEKEAQIRLEEINQKILALFEDVDGISVQGYTKDGTVKYWNKASERLYGYTKEEALGQKLWDFIIPENMIEPVKKHVLNMIEDGKGTPSEELMLKHKEGFLVPVLSSHTVISISDEDTMLFCMDVDLTEINKTQAALIKSEMNLKERTEMIELLLNSTAEAIYGIDEHGNCTFVNKACLNLLGFDESDLIGKNIHEAIHHSAPDGNKHELHSCDIYKASIKGESVYVEEDLFWKKDGTPLPVEYWSYPVKKNGKAVGGVVTFFDITEKKEQANKIKETLKLLSDYKFALDQAANIVITDAKGIMLEVNESTCEISGYSRDELIGRHSKINKSGYHTEAFYVEMWNTIKNGNVWRGEIKNLKKNGEYYWIDTTIVPFLDKDGKPEKYLAIRFDITDRKNAEHKLLEKTAQLAAIAEVNSKLIDYDDWLSSFDLAIKVIGETINADRSYIFKTILHPVSGIEVIKMQHEWCADGIEPFINHELISHLPFDQANEVLEQLLKGNTTSVLIDNLEDGEFKDLSRLQGIKSMLLVPIFENRSFWGFIGIDDCRDKRIWTESEITFLNTISLNISAAIESQNSKTELLLSNERFERVSQATNDAIWEFEIGKSQLLWNDGYWKLFGHKPSDSHATVENWESLIHPDDKERIIRSMNAHIETNESAVWVGEYRFKRADGSWAYIYDRGSVIRNEQGAPLRMVGAMQDISSRKEYEESLKKLNLELQDTVRELEMSNTDLEQFAFVASHDLQEPLRMITSFLTQLERKYEHVLDEKGKKYIYFATDGAKRMRQIILDLLDFSRVGRIDSEKTMTDMNKVVSDVLTMNHRLIIDKGAIIKSDQLPIINASKTLMTQVLQNLISNAVKYQMTGNTPRVQISCKDIEEHWQFSISDNGIGINPEYKDKIFNIFQRLHGKDEYSGTGVGLAVTKKAVEYHQGKIWVEENPTGGSIFHFTIKKELV